MLDSRNTNPVPDHLPEDLFARLERERLDADRRYNDALTEVDRAIRMAPLLPGVPRPFDEARMADLNAAWDILEHGSRWWTARSRGGCGFIWRLIGPPLETQRRFNGALVDHVNRNAAAEREWPRAIAVLLEVVGRESSELARFHSLLVQYLQTITAYIDSKDRSLGGPELAKRLAMTEQRMLALKRELDGMGGGAPAGTVDPRPVEPFTGTIDSLTYLGFEDQFRGSQPAVRSRVADYVPIFSGASDVVDVGCGRGELLGLLSARGATARGVDVSPAMVELCRGAGLDVEQGDAVGYLERQRDGSIGGLAAIQVVEHFPRISDGVSRNGLQNAGQRTARARNVNPAFWMAFFETYIRDLTINPLPRRCATWCRRAALPMWTSVPAAGSGGTGSSCAGPTGWRFSPTGWPRSSPR